MKALKKLFGHDDKFFDLLEASASEAQSSVKLLVDMIQRNDESQTLDEFIQTRRKDKRITEQITEQLCKTFVTPLEREDIEALSVALYKIPKTVEKFSTKFMICRQHFHGVDFYSQVNLLSQSTATVSQMVHRLRNRPHLEDIKDQNDQLHKLEGQADKLMFDLVKDLYSGKHDTLKVIVIMDLHETLEKIIDRCRDAGNVVFQIVLKYS